MPDRPGAQYRDHPNAIAGHAAMPRPLADYADFQFLTQCPTPACKFRRFPVAPVAAARPGITVADALGRLRCQDCNARPEIVLLARERLGTGEEIVALRIEADSWKPMR
jgi:hypothetical protein